MNINLYNKFSNNDQKYNTNYFFDLLSERAVIESK